VPVPPRDPLIIGGEEYADWRSLPGGSVLFRANDDQTNTMIYNLGKAIPGQTSDGLDVEFMIYTVQAIGSHGSEVIAHIQIDTGGLL
jgi:hypothetical protein